MKSVVIAAFALVASFALAIGCHESQPGTTPAQPQPVASVVPDAAPPLIDAQTPMGGAQGWPGTNQP
ncbi:MAG TPA: hypothetical protein VGG74_16570 [Kofleriaceae bacterium]|jgi:hypothetical protein